MLQRIQSIFMFIAAICMVAMTFLPIWEKADQESLQLVTINAFEVRYEQQNDEGQMDLLGTKNVLYFSIGAFVAAAVMLFNIFQYRNRMRQVKLNALFSLIVAGIMVGLVMDVLKANQLFSPEIQGNYLLGFYLPIGAMINNFIANRFIRKDEALVRSADRIR